MKTQIEVDACNLCGRHTHLPVRGFNPVECVFDSSLDAKAHICELCIDAINKTDEAPPSEDGWMELVPGEYWSKGNWRIINRGNDFGFSYVVVSVLINTPRGCFPTIDKAKEYGDIKIKQESEE